MPGAKAERLLDGPEQLRDLHTVDEIVAELADLTLRSARLHDDGSFLVMIAGRRPA
jgi:hypothetical protein